LGLSKNTYYNARDPKEKFLEKYAKLKSYVESVIEENSHYGIRRIKQELFDTYEITVGRDVLGKLLKLWGLSLKRNIRKQKPNILEKILQAIGDRANILKRIKLTAPLQAISSDITELNFKGGKAYLCVHKDVYGQMVYGWALGLNMKTELVMRSFNMALKRVSKLFKVSWKIIFHQDRGSQYTSYDYVEAMSQNNCLISYSQKGTPTDNPGQESFFGRFKSECAGEISEIETFEQLEKFVKSKIIYYNERRLHTSIGYTTPEKFTKSRLRNLGK
jgi:transposase InsO family protein